MTNELQGGGNHELSTDIHTITAEINAYQRVAGEAIFEIGRRLKHVKENDMAYGEWRKWLDKVGVSERQSSRFIRVYERFESSSPVASLNLTLSVMDALTTIDDEELEKERDMPDGSKKKLTEMSRREIEEFKKREKEAEEKAVQAQRAAEEADRRAEEAEARADQYRKSSEIERKKREEAEEREPEVRIEYIEKESEEPYDRRYDRPYDVERTNDFYVMMNEVDGLYKKYAHLRDSIGEMKTIAKYDSDLCKRYAQASDLWEMLGEIFNNDNDIIDVEII